MNRVIILGADHHNTLGMVRSLGIKGITTDVFIISRHSKIHVVHSKYINSLTCYPTDQDAVDALLAIKPVFGEKKVLLAGSDSISACIDRHYVQLKQNYVFFNAKGFLLDLMNKETMVNIATEVGMNVPSHIVYKVGTHLPENIEFPCITKAISSIDGSKSNTLICENRKELVDFLKTEGLCSLLQIEKYIEKEIEFQFIGVSLNGGETIIIPGHSHISRPNGIQNTYYFPYKQNDPSFIDTLEKAQAFIRKTGYSGLFSVEFLRGKDGVDYFLEMNFRNDGNAICVTDAGFNLPYIWYLYAIGDDYKQEINKSVFKPVTFCPEMFYVKDWVYGEISFNRLISDVWKANSFTQYYKGDNKSFFPRFSYFLLLQLKEKIKIKLGLSKPPRMTIG